MVGFCVPPQYLNKARKFSHDLSSRLTCCEKSLNILPSNMTNNLCNNPPSPASKSFLMKAHILPSLKKFSNSKCFPFHDDLTLVVKRTGTCMFMCCSYRSNLELPSKLVLIVKMGGYLNFVALRKTQKDWDVTSLFLRTRLPFLVKGIGEKHCYREVPHP